MLVTRPRLTPALIECVRTGKFEIVGEDLVEWRAAQHGTYRQNFSDREGWTQARSAKWYGVATETWAQWERGRYPVPEHLVRNLIRFSQSLTQILDELIAS